MRIIKLFAAATAALGLLASCQQKAEDATNPGTEFVPVSLTASFNTGETKVSYTETTTGGIKLQPAWKVGDKVIGFDGANNTYTFTVSEVDATTGVATLDGACPASCTLHLIYLYGASASSISNGSLNVSYANQAGTGSADNVYTMPAVMLADGTVTSGSGDFLFSNAGAIIGISAVKGVPNGTTVTKVTVSGEDLSAATITLDGSALKLTAAEKTDDAISTASLSDVTVTDANGTLSKLVLIAVPAGAKVSKVTVAAGGKDYSFNLGSAVELAAGRYPYINGSSGQAFTEDIVPVTGISFDFSSNDMNVGDEFTATVTVTPAEATGYTVTWTSSDPSVATVDENGKVTAVAPGTATITAKVGDETATFTVTVAPAVGYVEIEAKYDGTHLTKLKWATQNLSISDSGKKSWKGENTTAVKVPGTNEDVQIGDFFQWAAFAGCCGNATDSDKGLLIYYSFNNPYCVGDTGSSGFSFKSSDTRFNQATAPYHSGSAYDSKYSVSTNTELESSDDVAHIILGGKWRMPTSTEFKALYDATTWTRNSKDRGYYVTKKGEALSTDKSNALLFFPAAGVGINSFLDRCGEDGHCWTSSLYSSSNSAYFFYLLSTSIDPQSNYIRSDGFSVRPVSDQ